MSGSQPCSSMSNFINIQVLSSEEPLLHTNEPEDSDVVQLKPRHTIFLSHSGAQKNFVEQLCKDLEQTEQAPFFDKRPESLPKGERFAQLIFQAARQCQLAIVVVSEEYFSRSKWPMWELATFVQAQKCTILPLFLGLSCKEFGDLKRRQIWFERWEAWALEDARIRVDVWKEALNKLEQRNGMEYSEAFGEVAYRKDIVAIACTILEKSSPQDLKFPKLCYPVLLISLIVVMGVVMTFFSTSSQRPLI